ncbi:hypothetical protein Tco_0341429 [Tanacetum coccineum]
MGNINEPPVVKGDPKDLFNKLERPPTPDPEWNECKTVNSKPTQKWLSDLAKAEKSSKTFDDLISTLIDFSTFAMNRLQISDLTQYILTKAAKYDLQGIKYMVPNLWSLVKVAYDRHALLGTSHLRSKRQTFYGYASNKVSKHDVYSTKIILAVTNVKVNVWYGYGHLEEIEVQRSDQQLYKFMEGDFPRLHLNDIEDMLIHVVQNRIFNLKGEEIVYLAATLRMFTRCILIQKRVEDLHLGVESYQKKLNILRPLIHKVGITDLEPYNTYSNPQVRNKLKDMLNNLEMGYISVMPRRRWSNLDKKWSRIMVKDINCQLLERRLMRSLEKFVGEREYGEDLRLLQRTI